MSNSRVLKTVTSIALFSFLISWWPSVFAQQTQTPQVQQTGDTKKSDDTRLFMRAKLANSQRVMEGLVTEDFGLIRDGARQMKKIAEASHWPKTIDEIYQHHSVAFRRQCDKLVDHADRNDLQAAHYTYLHMSTTCIDCHDYVRAKFRVDRNGNGPIKLIPTEWDGPTKMKKLKAPEPDDDDTGKLRDQRERSASNVGRKPG